MALKFWISDVVGVVVFEPLLIKVTYVGRHRLGKLESFPGQGKRNALTLRPYFSDMQLVQKYPNAKVTGLSNSTTQKTYIDSQAKKLGLSNLNVTLFSLCYMPLSYSLGNRLLLLT